ncbi:MAG: chorismate mutase [Lachnospiraceae bacterium]|nr:chorismate mutase [Lachnospiraceae bacterium]
MDLLECRAKIDEIDKKLVDLFAERMEVAKGVAEYKMANNLPVLDRTREREKIQSIIEYSPDNVKEYTPTLYQMIFELSRSYQHKLLQTGSEITEKIKDAIENTPKLFPERSAIACQGIAGANSQIAVEIFFINVYIIYFITFEAVFQAIEKGLCKYGVIPVENSVAGSVNKVYDLMLKHNFYIAKSIRLKIDHNLLAVPGTKIENIKEIYSHEQAISQCSNFLSTLKDVKVIPCENTAIAAKRVAESGRSDVAALASESCVQYYGLQNLAASVQNVDNNYTRFICISKDLEIYPGANKTSIMMVLPHEPGALYKVLSRFFALDVNLIKLESRPLPSHEFEFMFYFDLEKQVYAPELLQLLADLPGSCVRFEYLGSYSEVI